MNRLINAFNTTNIKIKGIGATLNLVRLLLPLAITVAILLLPTNL